MQIKKKIKFNIINEDGNISEKEELSIQNIVIKIQVTEEYENTSVIFTLRYLLL